MKEKTKLEVVREYVQNWNTLKGEPVAEDSADEIGEHAQFLLDVIDQLTEKLGEMTLMYRTLRSMDANMLKNEINKELVLEVNRLKGIMRAHGIKKEIIDPDEDNI